MNVELNDSIKALGFDIESEFVPFHESRNRSETAFSLNWRVTLKYMGRKVLTTDYMAGLGHCPAYQAINAERKWSNRMTQAEQELVAFECRTGYEAKASRANKESRVILRGKALKPDLADFCYSILLDSDVIYSESFEDWAYGLGIDTDSRKAEYMYRQCLEIALRFQNIVDETARVELGRLLEDY